MPAIRLDPWRNIVEVGWSNPKTFFAVGGTILAQQPGSAGNVHVSLDSADFGPVFSGNPHVSGPNRVYASGSPSDSTLLYEYYVRAFNNFPSGCYSWDFAILFYIENIKAQMPGETAIVVDATADGPSEWVDPESTNRIVTVELSASWWRALRADIRWDIFYSAAAYKNLDWFPDSPPWDPTPKSAYSVSVTYDITKSDLDIDRIS